jgi:hypothetical protein
MALIGQALIYAVSDKFTYVTTSTLEDEEIIKYMIEPKIKKFQGDDYE